MDISDLPQEQRPWRVIGTAGDTKISVAPPTSIRIESGGLVAVIPMPLVIALQTPEAIAFMSNSSVIPYMYAASDRESRIRAARDLAMRGISRKRREFVAQLTAHGLSEGESWDLARLKYPLDI